MRGSFKRFIGNYQMMVFFIRCANALENFNRLFLRGFIYLNRLEAAFERGIRFDVLAIFIQRGRADDL